MQPVLCEVVGCGRPGVWIRIGPMDGIHEDALCQRCWANLQLHSPQQSRRYAPLDDPEGTGFAFSSGMSPSPGAQVAEAESDLIG